MNTDERKEVVLRILSVLLAGSLVVGSAIAPGILVAFAPLLGRQLHKKPAKIKEALHYARRQQWITLHESRDGLTLTVSNRGRRYVRKVQLDESLPTGKWDLRWRIVIFDIPNTKKNARESLRGVLKRLGFLPLQESVWMTPWPCDDQITALRELYGIPHEVVLIEASKIENEAIWRTKFDLS